MCRVIFVVKRCCVIESNKAMISRKLFRMPVLHRLFRHCKIHCVAIACLVACAILFSSAVRQDKIEPNAAKSVFESQRCHLVVFRQDGDEDVEVEEPTPVIFELWATTESRTLGAKRFILKQEFQIEIDRLHSVCRLEPKQLKKFEIASKGGIKKGVEDWTTALYKKVTGYKNPLDDPDREPIEEERYTDISEIDAQTLHLASNGFFNEVRPKTIVNSTFWKKTLNSTLSKEQKETWENFVTEQLEHKREKMADAAIASFNIEFGLTLEQQEAFAELVRPKLLGIKLKTIETIGR